MMYHNADFLSNRDLKNLGLGKIGKNVLISKSSVIVGTKNIFLGDKDYQQLFLIKKHIKKNFNIRVFSSEMIRDKNKVALSSRNNLLKKNDLKKSS